jgi:hypothetical protein
MPALAPVPGVPGARSVQHLGDSIVCAAADAAGAGTAAMRAGLLAAFARAEALGFTLASAQEALRLPEPPPEAEKRRA